MPRQKISLPPDTGTKQAGAEEAGLKQALPLRSFFMGGFECATHYRRDRKRIDVIAATKHDAHCTEDYALLAEAGILTVRDGLRWHLIERTPGQYDWSSLAPMLEASLATGVQVIWDLCHWGVPEWLDPFSPEFVPRLQDFAARAAEQIHDAFARSERPLPNWYCAVNEISFWAWVGGDTQHFGPFGKGRGPELKRQLVRASAAALRAVRGVDREARFVQPEPLIHISPGTRRRSTVEAAARHTASQFEAWDMLCGRREPELGGSEDLLDVLGVNFYWNNEWVHRSSQTPPGHPAHRPLHAMLRALHERYQHPILVTETGAEDGAAVGWLGYIGAEVREARRAGAEVGGICIYPVMDYPGWDDNRHCVSGLIELDKRWSTRRLRQDLVAELRVQRKFFANP